jgi:hypothetical protein
MIEHTPGPWRVYEQEIADKDQAKKELCDLVEGTPNFQPWLVYVTDDDWNLATAVTGCGERSKANARLIAAAPKMLAALQLVMSLYEAENLRESSPRGSIIVDPQWTIQARAAIAEAIAKATGVDPP